VKMESKLKEKKEEKFRLILKDIDFDFENDKSLKFAYYGERHISNGCMRLFVGEEEFLFNPDQVESLREFLESEK